MNGQTKAIARHLTAKYLLTLGLLGGLALANYLILRSQLAASRNLAEVVNRSGRQRALFQQCALLAQELATSPNVQDRESIRHKLSGTLQPLEATHHYLIRKDLQVPPPESVEAVYFDSPWLLDTEIRNFVAQVQSLVEVSDGELGPENPHVHYIRDAAASGRLANGLDAVVSAYQEESERRTDRLHGWAIWSLGSTVVVLVATGWFIFRPMVHRVRGDMHALAELNDTLERRVATRTALAEERARSLALSEQALRDQSRILQAILDQMGDGVIVVEKESEFRLFNPKARQLFGIDLADDVPDVWLPRWPEQYGVQLLKPDGQNPYPTEQLPLVRATRGESVDREEIVLRRPPENKVTWLSVTARPLVDGEGAISGSVAVLRDITQRKEAEQRLRISEALYHSLVDNLPLYVLRKDREGRFTFVNHLMCRLLQRPPDDVLGKTDFDLYPEELAVKYRHDDNRVIRTGEVLQRIEKHRTPDGRNLFVEVLKAPVRGDDGEFLGTQSLFLDATARIEAEEKLVQSERLAAIGQMVAGVAHESRNALQQIQACCGLLGWRLNGNREAQNLLVDIERAQDRLHRLFDDLRGYAAPIQLERCRRDVGAILSEAWLALAHLRDERDVALRQAVAVSDPHCEVDPLRLEQVFRNVLENALAACSDPVRIEVLYCEAKIGKKRAVQISIRDNGPGLNDEQQQKLFDPFFTTKSRGSGLGMAITRRIVEAHGGRIAVGTRHHSGTEILITIPRGEP